MSEEKIFEGDRAGHALREFEFGRRLGLQALGVMVASGAVATLADVSAAQAAAKSGTIKIGYVSPRTCLLYTSLDPGRLDHRDRGRGVRRARALGRDTEPGGGPSWKRGDLRSAPAHSRRSRVTGDWPRTA